MRITAELLPARERRAVDLGPDATGMDLVRALGLSPDVHILVRDDTPIPEDEPLREGETIRVISVVSGG